MSNVIPAFQIIKNNFKQLSGTIGMLYGDRSVYPTATLVASEIIKQGRKVVFIDAANRVDPYYLARLARYQRLDPDSFLNNAYVSRANTYYQYDVTVNNNLLEFMGKIDSSSLIIYGPLDLIDDEQVPLRDIEDILHRTNETFATLQSHNISTLMVSTTPAFQLKDREKFLLRLRQTADVIFKLETKGGFQQLIIEQGEHHGTNPSNRNNASSKRRSKLVKLPEGAQKRRPGNP